jgi:thiamine-monophosphate kinase
MGWNESSLHRWLARSLPGHSLRGGFGHDAAHLARGLAHPVLCVDSVVEGVHFEPDTSGALIGHKACARALSDLAASAARPRVVLAALRAGTEREERLLRAILRAIQATAAECGAELVGGDLSSGAGPLSVVVTALGERPGKRMVGRSGAREGDAIVVTGPCGGSRLGRHLEIEPRIDAGLWLAECGAHAMMDVSDGLELDLTRMARASDVAIELERLAIHADARRAARSDGRSPQEHALGDGEDHELVAALPRRALTRVLRERARRCPQLVVLGGVRSGSGVHLSAELRASVAPGAPRGWVHGG